MPQHYWTFLLQWYSAIHQGQTIEKNVQKSTFSLVRCSILTIPYLFHNLLSYFVIFPSLFLIKHLKFFVLLNLRGTILVYKTCPSPLLPICSVTICKCCNAFILLFYSILSYLFYQLEIGGINKINNKIKKRQG